MGNPPLEGLQYLQISTRGEKKKPKTKKPIRNSNNILLQKDDYHVLQLQCTEAPLKPYFLDRKARAREISAALSSNSAAFVPVFLGKSSDLLLF